MTDSISFKSHSVAETLLLGRKIGQCLPNKAIVTFSGPLGAGKTTLIQGIASTKTSDLVNSPTFVYHQRYQTTNLPIDHVDLYRLQTAPSSLGQTGILDLLEDVPGWLFIEWPLTKLPYPNDVPRVQIEASGQPEYSYKINTENTDLATKIKDLA